MSGPAFSGTRSIFPLLILIQLRTIWYCIFLLFCLKDSAYNGQMLPVIQGRDFSGVVTQVGSAVTKVAPGDEVRFLY